MESWYLHNRRDRGGAERAKRDFRPIRLDPFCVLLLSFLFLSAPPSGEEEEATLFRVPNQLLIAREEREDPHSLLPLSLSLFRCVLPPSPSSALLLLRLTSFQSHLFDRLLLLLPLLPLSRPTPEKERRESEVVELCSRVEEGVDDFFFPSAFFSLPPPPPVSFYLSPRPERREEEEARLDPYKGGYNWEEEIG